MPFRLRFKVKLSQASFEFNLAFIANGQSPHLITFKSVSEVRGLPSIGITRFQRYYVPLRLPPGSEPVVSVAGHDPAPGTGLPRYPSYLSGMLSPIPRWIKTGGSVTSLSCFGLPRILGGSASTTFLSGPAQGSLALRPARLLQPFRLTFFPRASAGWSPTPTAWVATGMNRQFPRTNSHPLATCALVAHQDVGVCQGEEC